MRISKGQIVQHHIKYKEIHGVDEIVLMSRSEHRTLHDRLRKTGKCKIPVGVINKASASAYSRSPKGKESRKRYNGKTEIISFCQFIEKGFSLREELVYNIESGNVSWSSWFQRSDSP